MLCGLVYFQVYFQMDSAEVPHEKLMKSIELIGTRLKPLVISN